MEALPEASTVEEESADLKGLKEHQTQLKSWLYKVQSKIYELETSYLEETTMGNLIKGWEADGRPPLKRGFDEKERLFSFSNQIVHEVRAAEAQSSLNNMKHKKHKKRKLETSDETYAPGEY